MKASSLILTSALFVFSTLARADVLEHVVSYTENYDGTVQTITLPGFDSSLGKLQKATVFIRQKAVAQIDISRDDASMASRGSYQAFWGTQVAVDIRNPAGIILNSYSSAKTVNSNVRGFAMAVGQFDANFSLGPIKDVTKLEVTRAADLKMLELAPRIAVNVQGAFDVVVQDLRNASTSYDVQGQSIGDNIVVIGYVYEPKSKNN